ncbi:amidase [Burkholderia sp. PU8-34]
MPELHELSATELSTRFRSRSLTPTDFANALLDHVVRWEPHINALAQFEPARVRAQAAASTQRWAAGQPLSDIDGVPVTLKELIATEGDRIRQGTTATRSTPASVDAPIAMRLREAGAVLLGKTTVPDYSMLASGASSLYGVTRNPWCVDNNTGGSSSGTAAAAAAGYGPLHVGTDIGGSIRIPSALCGLVGFKPSLGRVPIDPYYTGRCAGPMTRTIDDAALLMRHIAQPDWRDATSLPPDPIDWSIAAADVRGKRIGLLLDMGCGLAPDVEIVRAVEAAAETFRAHGAVIVPLPPMLNQAMLDGLDRFWQARMWAELERLSDDARERVLPYVVAWGRQGASVSGVEAVRGFTRTFEMRAAAARVFQNVDALLSPTTPVASYPAEWASPTNDPTRALDPIALTVGWNMGEQPALSINCGFTASGAPIGLQIVGPRFADRWVLQLGKAYETWRGAMPSWPSPPH